MATDDLVWWKKGIIYHIYPLSFMDSNGDGKGDIPGITARLDYLKWLGVDAVWISPMYKSPMADFGYDVADYISLNPQFGSMSDFEMLVDKIHSLDLHLIMDFVPNHTSEQHPWFLESRSSKNNPKRDWYIWKDPAFDGGPPTNWLSSFGGSGWEFDTATGQHYYHAFLKQQPDLNWRNKDVVRELLKVMRFWLDKGVDGFRVDVMWHLIKDYLFRDNPPNPDYREGQPSSHRQIASYSTDQPEVLGVVSKMREVIDSYKEKVLIGEIYLPVTEVVDYYGHNQQGAHLPLNFQLLVEEWNGPRIYKGINEYEGALPRDAWPNWVLGNHDRPRIASRVGADQARVAAMMLFTLRGTPTVYYGDEIGMEDAAVSKELMQDPAEINRDAQRTPMQWTSGKYAGFTVGTPWIGLNNNYHEKNVESQRENRNSILHLYKNLIALRRSEPALYGGIFIPVGSEGNLFAYMRTDEHTGKSFLIAVNLGHAAGVLRVPGRFHFSGKVLLATDNKRTGETISGEIHLDGNQGIVVDL